MKNQRPLFLLAVATVAMASLTACGEGEQSDDLGEELIKRTVVTKHEDGSVSVRQFEITQADHKRDMELKKIYARGKKTAAVVHDGSCAAADMWLFDQVNLGGHQICFIQSPKWGSWESVNLSSYRTWYFGPSWAGAVRSFWGGEDVSQFSGGACTAGYGAWQRRDSVTNCVSTATVLSLIH